MDIKAAKSSANILDGRHLARQVRDSLAERIKASGRTINLHAILVGDDGSAALYAQNQERMCSQVGIEYRLHSVDVSRGQAGLVELIQLLNADDQVDAIMMHMPLPDGFDSERMQALIDPAKDVEGVNPANIGNIVYGRRSLVPCTALACMELIESTGISLPGARCVIVGASNIVGKPVAVLLMQAEATVISTNKYTDQLGAITKTADVLVAAAGVTGLVTAEMVKPGTIVIDVGINRVMDDDGTARTVGDVDFDSVSQIAGHISPVPGGVGPMTVAMLLKNTVDAAGI